MGQNVPFDTEKFQKRKTENLKATWKAQLSGTCLLLTTSRDLCLSVQQLRDKRAVTDGNTGYPTQL